MTIRRHSFHSTAEITFVIRPFSSLLTNRLHLSYKIRNFSAKGHPQFGDITSASFALVTGLPDGSYNLEIWKCQRLICGFVADLQLIEVLRLSSQFICSVDRARGNHALIRLSFLLPFTKVRLLNITIITSRLGIKLRKAIMIRVQAYYEALDWLRLAQDGI
jgi:hypothetical protein